MEQTAIPDKLSNRRNGVSLVTWFIMCGLLIVLRLPPNLQTASTWITNRNKEIEGGQILVNGASIRGINDLEFGPDGLLFAASTLGNEIVILHPQSGAIIERIDEAQGVKAPSALVFGPDGSLYWASLLSGEIGRRDVHGEVRTQLVAKGLQSLKFSRDGKLYVSCGILGGKIFLLDPELTEPPHPINSMSGIDVVSGKVETGGISILNSITSDSQGRLYTARARGLVERYDPVSKEKHIIAELPSGLGDVALDRDDNIYVASVQDGSIYRIMNNGESQLFYPGGMVAPGGVAVISHPNGDEALFITDFWTLREYEGRTGKPGHMEHHLRGPAHIIPPMSISADGENLIVTSWASGVGVQVWNPDIREVLESYSGLNMPIHAIRFNESIIITEMSSDLREGRVVRLTSEGPITLFDAQHGIQVPTGLAATEDDLWLSDWASGTIWHIASDGNFFSSPVPIISELNHPEGIAVTPDGNLVVVESGSGCLSRVELKSGQKTLVAENLALGAESISDILPSLWIFNGVAVGETGNIYVTGDVGNVVYRFRL